ncbi:MAG TPA: hypothetical protein VGH28_22305 [Polyangiaceae bacterium]
MSTTTRRRFTHAALGGFAALALSETAHATPQATIEVMVLHATMQPGAGSIDPTIGNMPQLRRPPFSAYNTYKLLAKQQLVLVKGTPTQYTLVNGRVLQITLTNVLPGPRYEIAAAINQPGGGSYLNLLRVTTPPNETFFVAGQQFRGGVIIIGFTLH